MFDQIDGLHFRKLFHQIGSLFRRQRRQQVGLFRVREAARLPRPRQKTAIRRDTLRVPASALLRPVGASSFHGSSGSVSCMLNPFDAPALAGYEEVFPRSSLGNSIVS